jgi:hypothetical protein
MDVTSCIGGKFLSEATLDDWQRMNNELSAEYQSDALEAKRRQNPDEAISEPKSMNVHTHNPEKTLQALKWVLDEKTLDGLFELMAKERGYVRGGVPVALAGQDGQGTMDIWMRPIPKKPGKDKK